MRHVLLVVLALLLAGCGAEPAPLATPDDDELATRTTVDPQRSTTAKGPELPQERPADDYPMSDPPRFHVMTDQGQVDLRPWTICGPGYCADGAPDDANLVDVGTVDHLEFGFDLSGWRFDGVTFRELGTPCPRVIDVEATPTGERTFRIDPAGPAGRWAVDIFGRGPGGDAVTTVEWTTSAAGTSGPTARGHAAVLADNDGSLDSYGVELALRHLDAHYPDAEATIEVTATGGRSVTIPLRTPRRCDHQGQLFLTAPDERGREAATLGEGPFLYTARVRLGGDTYTGTGSWPEDVIRGYAPNVRLSWDPPLPGYADAD